MEEIINSLRNFTITLLLISSLPMIVVSSLLLIMKESQSFGLKIIIASLIILIPIVTILARAIFKSSNRIIDQINMITSKIMHGDLKFRADEETAIGRQKMIYRKLNSLIDALLSPLYEVMSVMRKIANKNMTAKIEGTYKQDLETFKSNVNSAITNLSIALQDVGKSVADVHTGSGQVAAASQEVAQGATEQAAALQEITSTVHEIKDKVKDNANNASSAKDLSESAKNYAFQSNQQMGNMITAMNEINESSNNIAKIIKVIDEIAFQTNLLALNAAVEAARAGTHGKGFAVVAEEVKNLAERSSKAAEETTSIIEDSMKKVSSGVNIADQTAKDMQHIIESSDKTHILVNSISDASQEQAHSVEEILKALEQINIVTQNNTANSEESAAVSKDLSSRANQLNSSVEEFALSKDDIHQDIAVTWNDRFKVDIREFDSEHQKLFDLINDFYTASRQDDPTRLLNTLEGLKDYTFFHFSNEEKHMRIHDFPGLAEQVKMHTAFTQQVSNLVDDVARGKSIDFDKTIKFLEDWLIHHILEVDTKYTKFFNERGLN